MLILRIEQCIQCNYQKKKSISTLLPISTEISRAYIFYKWLYFLEKSIPLPAKQAASVFPTWFFFSQHQTPAYRDGRIYPRNTICCDSFFFSHFSCVFIVYIRQPSTVSPFQGACVYSQLAWWVAIGPYIRSLTVISFIILYSYTAVRIGIKIMKPVI